MGGPIAAPAGGSVSYKLILAFGMLFFGSVNTLVTKLADETEAKGLPDYPVRKFDHPFVQAMAMFVGEFLCLIAYKLNNAYKRSQDKPEVLPLEGFNPLVLVIPGSLDMIGTSMMYVGLTMTYASVFQMLRGSVVIFTGILSVIFLGRKLYGFHWLGMFLVLAGLSCVGVASLSDDSGKASNPVVGDILVIAAQVVVSVQMVVEEKFVTRHNVPALLTVGWEGIFGFCVSGIIVFIFYYVPGDRAGNHFENAEDAVLQIKNSSLVLACICGTFCSIAFFNFFGISVTKSMNATTRMVLDSVRTFVIWIVSLAVGWEDFQWIQVAGFALLLIGTCIYNKILVIPGLEKEPSEDGTLSDPLLDEETPKNSGSGQW